MFYNVEIAVTALHHQYLLVRGEQYSCHVKYCKFLTLEFVLQRRMLIEAAFFHQLQKPLASSLFHDQTGGSSIYVMLGGGCQYTA